MDESELSKHNTKNDAWVSYKGKLLNITSFLNDHPGGDSVIMPYLGKDITDAFIKAGHSAVAEDMIEDLLVEKTKDKNNQLIAVLARVRRPGGGLAGKCVKVVGGGLQ